VKISWDRVQEGKKNIFCSGETEKLKGFGKKGRRKTVMLLKV